MINNQAQRQLTEERTLQEQLLLSVEEQQELLDTVASVSYCLV